MPSISDSNKSLEDFILAKKNVINLLNELKENLSHVNFSDLIRKKINIIKNLNDYIEAINELIQDNLTSIDDLNYINYIENNLIPKEVDLDDDKLLKTEIIKRTNNIKTMFEDAHEVYNFEQKIDYFHIFLKSTFNQLIFYIIQKEDFQIKIDENERNAQKLKVKAEKSYNDFNEEKKVLKDLLNNLEHELQISKNENSEVAKKFNELKNKPIGAIYDQASTKYTELENLYRKRFYNTLVGLALITIIMFIFKSAITQVLVIQSGDLIISQIEFWAIKISLVLLGITLISYFLKQSTHYQKLADQSYQTQMEINAFSSYMFDVPDDVTNDVRRQLALKYFGKEINESSHKNISNLITDQMKSTTEMVKAVTEMIKKPDLK